MIVYSKDLPSKGLGSDQLTYSIRPLVYKELYDYRNNEEVTDLRKFTRDLKLLVSIDPNIERASVLDADFLIYLLKALTISEELTYDFSYKCHCEHHKGQVLTARISSKDLIFNQIQDEYLDLKSIELTSKVYEWHNTTIGDFLDYTGSISPEHEKMDIDLIKLASLFKSDNDSLSKVVGEFMSSTQDDIKMITLLKAVYFNLTQPIIVTCEKGGKTEVTLNNITSDLFRLVLQNGRFNPFKIHFK